MYDIIHVITGLEDGGAEAMLYRLVTRDLKRKQLVVSLMTEGKYGPLLKEAGVDVIYLKMPQGKLSAGGVWALWKLLRKERSSVVQTWMYHGDFVGGILARLAGVRRIVWGIHNTTLERGSSRVSTRLIAKLYAILSSWVPDAIVCCAERARIVHRELGYDDTRMTIVPNGYDLARFHPDSDGRHRLRKEWGIDPEMPVIGMVARFDPAKDHLNFLESLQNLKRDRIDFKAVLIGTGLNEANEEICEWLASRGMRDTVMLLGARGDIPAVMSALDLHVLSSRAEAFPNVLAEAMACCTPCITTDVGDAAVIVGSVGWVVPSRNSEELARSLKKAIALRATDSSQWSILRQHARERINDNFSIDVILKKYELVWRIGF